MPADLTLEEAALNVTGMDCASCVSHVTRAMQSVPGVQDCQVNLARGRATVTFNPNATSAASIAQAVTNAGYPAHPDALESSAHAEEQRLSHQSHEARAWLRRAIVGVALWLPVESTHWLLYLTSSNQHHAHSVTWMDWLTFATSTVAIAYLGAGFYRGAYAAAKRLTTSMDTLISMGATVAYLYSLLAMLGFLFHWWHTLPHLYFMESTGLLALISTGHYLEARARQSAGKAISQLLRLAPDTALKLKDETGSRAAQARDAGVSPAVPASPFDEVPVSSLHAGDLLLVRPGDRIPIDAVVTEGRASVDESMLTGESIPVTRTTGDSVIGGTINLDGRLTLRVTKVGAETALAQIVKLVERAQSAKPPVQKLADQISAIFVPAVLGVALLTGVAWYLWGATHAWTPADTWAHIANAVCSVLIIACPCALGLALPAAVMVGTGMGARRGILIRDIDAIQHSERLTTVILDKTGTVTRGKPAVSRIVPAPGTTESDLLRLAAAAEQYSEHPLAKAIVAEAQRRNLDIPSPDSFSADPGRGVTADIEGATLLAGNAALLAKHNVTVPTPADSAAGSIVHIARGNQLLGSITLEDDLKPDSKDAIARLHSLGLRTLLLTGDNRATAESVARRVGIDDVRADVRPSDKARVVEELKRSAGVAMVGDGVNDAPALAAADVGVAIGSGGSDVAKEAGAIVLVSGSLHGVVTAIRLSRATMRCVRQNLFFAFAYNVVAIPLAALGYLNPLVAAAAMALSDVTVLGNALRLRRANID